MNGFIGFVAGAPIWGSIGLLIAVVMFSAKKGDERLSTQEIDDLLENRKDHIDVKV